MINLKRQKTLWALCSHEKENSSFALFNFEALNFCKNPMSLWFLSTLINESITKWRPTLIARAWRDWKWVKHLFLTSVWKFYNQCKERIMQKLFFKQAFRSEILKSVHSSWSSASDFRKQKLSHHHTSIVIPRIWI